MITSKLKRLCAIAALATFSVLSVHAKDTVPAKLSIEGTVISDVTIANPFAVPFGTPFRHVIAGAEGKASHMGNITATFDFWVHLEPLITEAGFVGLKIVSVGTFELVRSNGDMDTGDFTNTRIALFGDPEPSVYVYTNDTLFANGGHLTGAGWLEVIDGVQHFGFDATGFLPNQGQAKK
jgi:hypothetical protein